MPEFCMLYLPEKLTKFPNYHDIRQQMPDLYMIIVQFFFGIFSPTPMAPVVSEGRRKELECRSRTFQRRRSGEQHHLQTVRDQ